MAIKIDLLPGYVGLRRVRKALSWGAAILVAGTAGVLFAIYYKDTQRLEVVKQNLAGIETNAAAAEKAKAAAETATKAAEPQTVLVNFLVAAGRTGAERAALIDLVSRYIRSGTVVNAIDISDGTKVNITAKVQTPDDYSALVLNLRRGSKSNGGLLFAEDPKTNMVVPSGIPGFPAAKPVVLTPGEQPIPIPFPLAVTLTGVLLNPVKLPVEPAAGGAAAPADGTAPADPTAPKAP